MIELTFSHAPEDIGMWTHVFQCTHRRKSGSEYPMAAWHGKEICFRCWCLFCILCTLSKHTKKYSILEQPRFQPSVDVINWFSVWVNPNVYIVTIGASSENALDYMVRLYRNTPPNLIRITTWIMPLSLAVDSSTQMHLYDMRFSLYC